MGIFNKITPEKIEKMAEKKDVNGLIDAINSKDPEIRKLSVESLGSYTIRNATSVPFLIPLLNDENADVREATAQSLGYIGDLGAVESLVEALKDSDSDVREKVVSALGSIGDKRAIDPLIDMLKDNVSMVRYFAAVALGELGDEKATPALIDYLQMDPEFSVRTSAAEALGKLNDPRAIEPLYHALMDKEVYFEAARSILQIQDPGAIDALCKAMTDDFTAKTKLHIAEIVIREGNDNIVDPIQKFLDEYKDPVYYKEINRVLSTVHEFMEWKGANSKLFKSLYENVKKHLGIEEI